MSEAAALYRCVCGTDVPVQDGGVTECPRCGRKQRTAVGLAHPGAETVVLSGTTRKGGPEPPQGEPGAPEAGARRPRLTGQVIDHYEILEELGRGGMGTVYRALDRSLERYVALKILDSEEARGNRQLIEAFVHEARTQARMNHPGIATIYYIGELNGMTYFAMEIIAGKDLESRLHDGRLPFREVIDVGIQVVQALKEAESRGVIHRDIKPGNIILGNSGRVKVTDFGLSKTEKGGLQITGSRQITGTPYYIAPEQARGETTDLRSDIYSLGATLFHLAYGSPPFEGDNFMSVISRHLSEPVRFPLSSPADVLPGFQYLIAKMLAKSPDDRFQSYEELERKLAELRPEALMVAALGRRALASLVDHAGIFLLGMALAMILNLAARGLAWVEPHPFYSLGATALGFSVFQALSESTVGKMFGKLRLTRIDGLRLRRRQLLLRGLAQFMNPAGWTLIPLLGSLFGWSWSQGTAAGYMLTLALLTLIDSAWALTNRNRRTLHDLIFKTWVLDRA